jgi:hypothetical protein
VGFFFILGASQIFNSKKERNQKNREAFFVVVFWRKC